MFCEVVHAKVGFVYCCFLCTITIVNIFSLQGKGAVYSFDPVGSYQRDSFKAGGSASAMLQPLLDNQVK